MRTAAPVQHDGRVPALPLTCLVVALAAACVELASAGGEEGAACADSGACAAGLTCLEGRCDRRCTTDLESCLLADSPCAPVLEACSQQPVDCGGSVDVCGQTGAGRCFDGACCTGSCTGARCGATVCGVRCAQDCPTVSRILALTPPGELPSDRPRRRAFAACASGDGEGLVFGGQLETWEPDATLFDGDTWRLAGEPPRWERLAPSTAPAPRYGAGMTWDAEARRYLLYGGSIEGEYASDELWSFDGVEWMQLAPSGPELPPPSSLTAFAFDPLQHGSVLFGGSRDPSSDSTWLFQWSASGGSWTRLSGEPRPVTRSRTVLVFDGEGLLLLGGHAPDSHETKLGDLWRHAAGRWTALSPASLPSPRDQAAAARFGPTGVLLFGGNAPARDEQLADLWLFDSTDGEFLELPPATDALWPREGACALSLGPGRTAIALGKQVQIFYDDLWLVTAAGR